MMDQSYKKMSRRLCKERIEAGIGRRVFTGIPYCAGEATCSTGASSLKTQFPGEDRLIPFRNGSAPGCIPPFHKPLGPVRDDSCMAYGMSLMRASSLYFF